MAPASLQFVAYKTKRSTHRLRLNNKFPDLCKALITLYKLKRVQPVLKLTQVSFCNVNTANPD